MRIGLSLLALPMLLTACSWPGSTFSGGGTGQSPEPPPSAPLALKQAEVLAPQASETPATSDPKVSSPEAALAPSAEQTASAEIPRPDPPRPRRSPLSACQLNGSKPAEISLVALAHALQNPGLKRRPVESNDEFEMRAEKLLGEARKIIGSGSFKFTVPVPSDQITFDAAQGALTVHPAPISGGLVPTMVGNGNRVVISRLTRDTGRTDIQTPFDGRQTVAKQEEIVLAVNVGGGDYRRWPRGFKTLTIQISPNETPSTKQGATVPQLAVLFSGRLRAPYLLQEVTRQNSQLDIVRDLTIQATAIMIDLECAALFDTATNLTLATIAVGPN
jgi:hypothetical protein